MISLLARFSLVGAVNTIIGFAIVASLDVGFHVHPAVANAIAYAFGITFSYTLTQRFVFRARAGVTGKIWKYVLALIIAFFVNQIVLFTMGKLLGAGSLQHLAAQLAGMAAYTGTNFLLCSQWVFPEEAKRRYMEGG